jgi:hypothetical protein
MSPPGPAAAGFSTRRIQAIVESLIDILDENNGDPDLEPSLGWSRTYATTRHDIDPALVDLEEGNTVGCFVVHAKLRAP